jgi:hypothetical protein
MNWLVKLGIPIALGALIVAAGITFNRVSDHEAQAAVKLRSDFAALAIPYLTARTREKFSALEEDGKTILEPFGKKFRVNITPDERGCAANYHIDLGRDERLNDFSLNVGNFKKRTTTSRSNDKSWRVIYEGDSSGQPLASNGERLAYEGVVDDERWFDELIERMKKRCA